MLTSLRRWQLPTAAATQPIGAQQEMMRFSSEIPVLSLDKPLAPLKGECQKWEGMEEAVAANALSKCLNGPTVEVHDGQDFKDV